MAETPLLGETKSLLRDLVGFDTTSRNSNLPLIEHVADYLSDHGAATRLIPSADGAKANLFATIGPDIPGGVVLSGHSDVVPVDGQNWSTDPFALTEADGRRQTLWPRQRRHEGLYRLRARDGTPLCGDGPEPADPFRVLV